MSDSMDPRPAAGLAALHQDARYALRSLRKRSGFATLIVVTLAVGIGAATAMFSVANGVLLRPLPLRDQDRVIVAWREDALRGGSHLPFIEEVVTSFGRESRTVHRVAAMASGGAQRWPMRLGDDIFFANASLVGGSYFDVLGVRPLLGRTLRDEDDVLGAAPVIVISQGLWERRFGGEATVIGRLLRFNGVMNTIVGVMPAGFDMPRTTDLWVPIVFAAPPPKKERADGQFVAMVGRLAPGASIDGARREFDAYLARRAAERPDQMPNVRADLRPISSWVVGEVRPAVLILLAASGLLLAIACVNVANLLLIRGAGREQELAVRTALGASRGRLAQQLLTESVVLGMIGGVLGVVLAALAVRVLVAAAPPELPRLDEIALDGRVLFVAVATSLASALAFGLAPALWALRADIGTPLRGGMRAGGGGRGVSALKRLLAAGQVALALVVLVGAGLLGNSLLRLQRIDLGFRAERLTSLYLVISARKYDSAAKVIRLMDQVLPRIGSIPGVTSVSPTLMPPLLGQDGFRANYVAEGQTHDEATGNPEVNVEVVGPEHFRTIGLPLLRGRAFTEQDRDSSELVAVVSTETGRRTWPGRDPLGQRLRLTQDSAVRWITVVGVVGESRYRDLTTAMPSIYVPYKQLNAPPLYLLIRSTGEVPGLVPAVLGAIREVEPESWLPEASSVKQIMSKPLARPRFNALLLALFAGASLLLASVGIYGLMTSLVGQRMRELGVRVALGARPVDVLRLVLREGMLLALAGAVAGLAIAVAGSRALAAVLFEVKPGDPVTFAGVTALLLLVAAAACYVPARRASRVDPLLAMRSE
jgi:putative ABC transport system permease protein